MCERATESLHRVNDAVNQAEQLCTEAKPQQQPHMNAHTRHRLVCRPCREHFIHQSCLALIEHTNATRVAAGLCALRPSKRLSACARRYVRTLVRDGVLHHRHGSRLSERLRNARYLYSWGAENLARRQRDAAEVMQGWMNSPGHRANLMNVRAREIGVHAKYDSHGLLYWIQVFAAPSEQTAEAAPALASAL